MGWARQDSQCYIYIFFFKQVTPEIIQTEGGGGPYKHLREPPQTKTRILKKKKKTLDENPFTKKGKPAGRLALTLQETVILESSAMV